MRVLSVDLGTANTVAVLSDHGVVEWTVGRRCPRPSTSTRTAPCTSAEKPSGGRARTRRATRRTPSATSTRRTIKLGEHEPAGQRRARGHLRPRAGSRDARCSRAPQLDEIRLTHPARVGPEQAQRAALRRPARGHDRRTRARSRGHRGGVARRWPPARGLRLRRRHVRRVRVSTPSTASSPTAACSDVGGLDVDQALLEHIGRSVSHKDPAGWQRLMRPVTVDDHRARLGLREELRLGQGGPLRAASGRGADAGAVREGRRHPRRARGAGPARACCAASSCSSPRSAGPGVTPEHVYLVGGSCRMPLVAQIIAEKVGIVPTNPDHPETIVALRRAGRGPGRRSRCRSRGREARSSSSRPRS